VGVSARNEDRRELVRAQPRRALGILVGALTVGSAFPICSRRSPSTSPVYIGDTITAEAEFISTHATKPVTRLRVRVARQTGETVLEGEAWCNTLTPDVEKSSP